MSTANLAALRAALTTSFKAGFVTGDPPAAPLPVRYENQPFKQPEDKPWGAFSIATGGRDYSALGAKETRTVGIAFLQVFLQEETGTRAAFEAADIVAALWDGKSLAAGAGGTVQFLAVSPRKIGRTPDGLYQYNIEAPFHFDVQAP